MSVVFSIIILIDLTLKHKEKSIIFFTKLKLSELMRDVQKYICIILSALLSVKLKIFDETILYVHTHI
jgi:hypothetical protein